VSELNPVTASDSPSPDSTHPIASELVELLEERVPPVREGLPRSYRMRADSHYVDQLEARSSAPAIRVIPTRQIDCPEPASAGRLDPLARSIAARGVLQPLLVRRQDGRYKLIAGRKRLAAAIAAGVAEVPCLMYEVDDADASAIAEAENLRAPAPVPSVEAAADDVSYRALRVLSKDVASLASAAALIQAGPSGASLQQRVAVDLVQSQAWRAAWLAHATSVATGARRTGRPKRIGAIIERVAAGFDAESRLTGLRLDCSVSPNAAASTLDEDLGFVAVMGCILATLSSVESAEGARVEVRADAVQAGTLRVEVVQRIAPVAPETVRMFEDPVSARLTDLTFTIAVLALKAVAAAHSGTADFMPINGRGGVIRATFSGEGPLPV
jgi:hypothetical protein